MKIELRNVAEIRPYENNPRLNDEAVDAVASDDHEHWAPIPGFEGLYEVSSFGRVRRSSSSRTAPSGYVLAARPTHDGYLKYSLFKCGRYRHVTGHRLVALTFLGPPPFPKAHVAHQDGDRRNNRLANLRWATAVENEADKQRHGTARGASPGERHHNAKLNAALVAAMRCHAIAGLDMSTIASKFGVPKITAYDAIVGKTWSTVTSPQPLQRTRRKVS